MPLTKSRFCLDFSLPLTEQDWANAAMSHCKLVMIPLAFATPIALRRFSSLGMSVVIRVGEGEYYGNDDPQRIRGLVYSATQDAHIEAVIAGVEPENGYSMRYGAVSWGQPHAYEHRYRFDLVRIAVQSLGVKVVSPGWTMHSISEDEPAQPGRVTWREIVMMPQKDPSGNPSYGYDSADGCGCHIYLYGYDSLVDQIRLKFAIKVWQELYHQPLWIDEIGISGNHTQIEKAQAYMDITDLLIPHILGQRIELISPFISNGTPNGQWDPRFLLTDPLVYRQIGLWMQSP